jgi:small ligand-binding sensory domain FIST
VSTHAGAGLSIESESAAAGRSAARAALDRAGCDRADWGLVFATFPHRPYFAAMLAAIQETLGTERITGCSGWGVLSGSQEVEGEPGVVVLAVRSDQIQGTPVLAPIEKDRPLGAALEIGRQVHARGANALLVLMPDPFAARPDLLLEALAKTAPGLEVVGAASSGDPKGRSTFQFYGRNVATRAAAGLLLAGGIRRQAGVTQGCQPLGDPCRITRGEGNVILELDGLPAAEVLRARLPAPLRDAVERIGSHLFLGVPADPDQETIAPGEYLVRALVGVDLGRGAIVAGTTVREGQPLMLVVRDAQSARDDLKAMLRRLRPSPAGPAPAFGLYFNCAARGTPFHGIPGVDTAFISSALDDLPVAGLFGNAEFAPLNGRNHVFTYTGVLATVAEES